MAVRNFFKKKFKRDNADEIKPQIIKHSSYKDEDVQPKPRASIQHPANQRPPLKEGNFADPQFQNRTSSLGMPVVKRPLQATVDPGAPKDNPLAQSSRSGYKIQRVSRETEQRQSRPSIMSSRRVINESEDISKMLAERDESSEDSKGEDIPIAGAQKLDEPSVETVSNKRQFEDLMQSHRSGRIPVSRDSRISKPKVDIVQGDEKTLKAEDFEVVPSPLEVQQQQEEAKGAITSIKKNGGYNVPKDQDHFDMRRQSRDVITTDAKVWNDDAMEDSDEEFQPLSSIIPKHMQHPEERLDSLNAIVPAKYLAPGQRPKNPELTNLEQQMEDMERMPSSKEVSFSIDGSSQRIKSNTEHAKRASRQDPQRDVMQSLLAHNLSLVEGKESSDGKSQKELEGLKKMGENIEDLNRKTQSLLEQPDFTAFHKRQTITSIESFNTGESATRRGAVYEKVDMPSEESHKEPSEKSYDSESDIDITDIIDEESGEEEEKNQEEDYGRKAGVGVTFLQDLITKNKDEDEEKVEKRLEQDVIHLIDESERKFIRFAQQKLVDNRKMLEERFSVVNEGLKRKELVEQRVLTEVRPRNYGFHEAQFMADRQNERDTCIAVSDEIVAIGTHLGTFNCYNRETCRPYGRFAERSNDFDKNPVTSMHFHPLRPEYIAVGFQGGQFMIVDLSILDNHHMLKPRKLVKDHHRGLPIVSVKFCDWIRERQVTEESKGAPRNQDLQAWMIVSVDTEGCVVLSCIRDVALGLLKASKLIIMDPSKSPQASIGELDKIQTMEPRFFKVMFPQGEYNDSQTWLAIASANDLHLLQVTKESSEPCLAMSRPTFYPSERTNKFEPFPKMPPVLSWGYGRSPCYKHRTHAMLAVAWGSMIQLILLTPDDEKTNKQDLFRLDGQYFIAPGAVQDIIPGTSIVQDVRIESIKFLSESVLFVYTSTHDIRVLYTQSFMAGHYKNPSQAELENEVPKLIFDKLDSRLKLLEANSAFTKEQRMVEMERRKFLSNPLQLSPFGAKASQTLSSHEDWIVFITEAGYCSVQHMTWQEYVETSEKDMDSTWIDTFQKMLDIFDGKIKGFKGVVDDRTIRQETMKAELKLLVTELIDKLISQWKSMEVRMENTGMGHEEVVEHFENKQRALIKRSIEMCVDIWEPEFLCKELYEKFREQRILDLFAEELKPYILAGTFSEYNLPEHILIDKILEKPRKRFLEQEQTKRRSPSSGQISSSDSPAESYEKMIVSLNFKQCSTEQHDILLAFCKEKQLSTGLFYMAINYGGDDGVLKALHDLRNLYLHLKEEELNVPTPRQIINRDDLHTLESLEADMPYREVFEKSSMYTGIKLLWCIRLTLLGRRFPRGHFEMRLWQQIVHEVLDIITQREFMKTLLDIDAVAFFQVITIAFNNPSKQYDFLRIGRGQQVNLMADQKFSMTHAELIKRVSDFCLGELEEGNETRLQYLFFIASIAEEDQQSRDRDFYYKVTLELIRHHNQFLSFNRSLLKRQMTQKQMYRKMSRQGVKAPDRIKHVVLSEESIMSLVRKSEPLEPSEINYLVEMISETSFDSIKFMLFEKQEAYTKCLQLLVENENLNHFVTLDILDHFSWIIQTYFLLEKRISNRTENTHNGYQFRQFEQEIYTLAEALTRINAHKTVGLIDCLFQGQVSQHLIFTQRMSETPEEQYKYTNMLLIINIDQAKNTMTQYSLEQKMAQQANDWLRILNVNLELACQLEPESVVNKIKSNLKQNFYPAEECLKICQKYKQTEACAILCKNIGRYKDSVQYYITLINTTINQPKNIQKFKQELYSLDKHIRVTLLRQKKKLADKEFEMQRQMEQNFMSGQQDLDIGNFQQLKMSIDSVLQNEQANLVPAIYSSNLPKKDTLADAIKLTVFKGKCELVSLLERVLKLMMKMMQSHPDEVLRQNDEIWIMIIEMMFGLTQNKELHRKRYCRRYLIVKMVALVRHMLQFISLNDVMSGILRKNQNIKFRSVKKLIADVFLDKRAETNLCWFATTISKLDLQSFQNQHLEEKANGLTFMYARCDICGLDVRETSMRALSSFSKTANDGMNLLLFDCQKENYYNHAYHERCLRQTLKEERRKDKKASLKDAEILKGARCIICYRQNQNIGIGQQGGPNSVNQREAGSRRIGAGSRAGRATPLNRNATEIADNVSSVSSQGSQTPRTTQRASQRTFEDEQYERISKRLVLFERDITKDMLKAENFEERF